MDSEIFVTSRGIIFAVAKHVMSSMIREKGKEIFAKLSNCSNCIGIIHPYS